MQHREQGPWANGPMGPWVHEPLFLIVRIYAVFISSACGGDDGMKEIIDIVGEINSFRSINAPTPPGELLKHSTLFDAFEEKAKSLQKEVE